MKHQQLYGGDPSSTQRFTGNPTKTWSNVKISTDWLLIYSYYTKRSRDSKSTYGKKYFLHKFRAIINSEENSFIVNRRLSITLILMTSNPIQIFQFPSETTHYEEQDMQDKYVILYVYGNIQRAYKPDQYYPHS